MTVQKEKEIKLNYIHYNENRPVGAYRSASVPEQTHSCLNQLINKQPIQAVFQFLVTIGTLQHPPPLPTLPAQMVHFN